MLTKYCPIPKEGENDQVREREGGREKCSPPPRTVRSPFGPILFSVLYFPGLCALYDDQIVVEAPCVPSTSRPANPDYAFEYIGNQQLEKLHHTFTVSSVDRHGNIVMVLLPFAPRE